MSKMIVEGTSRQLKTIQQRFRSFGVTFTNLPEEVVVPDPTPEEREATLKEFQEEGGPKVEQIEGETKTPQAPEKKKKGFSGR